MVVFFINTLTIGGAEKLVIDLCRAHRGSCIVTLFNASNEYSHSDVSRYTIFSSEIHLALLKLIRAQTIHFNLFPVMWMSVFFIFSKKNLIFTEHNTHNRRRNFKILRIFEYFVYKRFNSVIAISEGCRQALLKWQPTICVQVIPNGVKLFKSSQKSNTDTSTLLMVGRFCAQKDQLTIARSLRYLSDDYQLVCVGPGASESKEKFKSFIKTQKVQLYDASENIEKFYRKSAIYVQSSHWEGFGLAVIEAMSCGLPVIGTDVAGLRDLVMPQLLFQVGDERQLSEKIRLLEDEEFFHHAVVHSLAVCKKYSFDTMYDEYKSLYS